MMETVLSDLTSAFNEHNLEQQVRSLIQLLQQSTGLESTYFTRIDLDKGIQQVVYALNSGKLQLHEGLTVNWDDTLCKRGKRIKWLILPLHESETDRHLIGLSG